MLRNKTMIILGYDTQSPEFMGSALTFGLLVLIIVIIVIVIFATKDGFTTYEGGQPVYNLYANGNSNSNQEGMCTSCKE